MDNPPSQPPPSQPPPYQPPAYQPPAAPPPSGYGAPVANDQKRNQAFLSYLVTWITGLIFLYGIKPKDPDTRYHAAQSIVFFGGLTVLSILVGIVAKIGPLSFLGIVGTVINLVTFVGWIYCLVKSWQDKGARFEIPIIGGFVTPYAEQLAASAGA